MKAFFRKAVLFFLLVVMLCGAVFLSCDSMSFSGYVGPQGGQGGQGEQGEKGDQGKPGEVKIDDDDDDEDDDPDSLTFYLLPAGHDFTFCS